MKDYQLDQAIKFTKRFTEVDYFSLPEWERKGYFTASLVDALGFAQSKEDVNKHIENAYKAWERNADKVHELLHPVEEAYDLETSEDYKRFAQMARIDPDDLRSQLLG